MTDDANRQLLTKRMRWAGRIICLVITVFGGIMLVGEATSEFLSQGFVSTPIEATLLVLIGMVALAGCVLSWRKDLPVGILLVITSAGLGIHIGIFAGRNHFMVWSVLGLPHLIAGLLLLCAWQLSRHKGQTIVLSSNPGAGKKP